MVQPTKPFPPPPARDRYYGDNGPAPPGPPPEPPPAPPPPANETTTRGARPPGPAPRYQQAPSSPRRMADYQEGFKRGWWTINDIRRMEGLMPLSPMRLLKAEKQARTEELMEQAAQLTNREWMNRERDRHMARARHVAWAKRSLWRRIVESRWWQLVGLVAYVGAVLLVCHLARRADGLL